MGGWVGKKSDNKNSGISGERGKEGVRWNLVEFGSFGEFRTHEVP